MNKSYLLTGLGLLMAATSLTSARADDERWPRWYVGLSGGYTFMQDQDISGAGNSKASFDGGYGVGASIGYLPTSSIPIINSMRFEAEITYHQNDLDKVTRTNGSQVGGHGDYNTTAYMVNAFYDFPTGSKWSPYIGAGVGFADVQLSNNGIGNTADSDTEFAYQGLVGIGYAPDSLPNTQWTLGYRYLATSDPKFTAAAGSVNTEYSTHNIEVGAKFRF